MIGSFLKFDCFKLVIVRKGSFRPSPLDTLSPATRLKNVTDSNLTDFARY